MSDDDFADFDDAPQQVPQAPSDPLPTELSQTATQQPPPPNSELISENPLKKVKNFGELNKMILKKFKKDAEKPAKRNNEDEPKFKNIGYNEKIYKFTDIYFSANEKVQHERLQFIEKQNGLFEIAQFESQVTLGPFNLTEAFHNLAKKKKEAKEHLKEEKEPKETPLTGEVQQFRIEQEVKSLSLD